SLRGIRAERAWQVPDMDGARRGAIQRRNDARGRHVSGVGVASGLPARLAQRVHVIPLLIAFTACTGSDADVTADVADSSAHADATEAGVADARAKPKPGDPCVTRDDCDDGVFCDGVEECLAGACTSARNTACRDPGGCADSRCDE